jgi:OOP family OmpA-OmpF porin
MQTTSKLIFSALAMAALMPVAAVAQSYPNQGYWVDGSGRIVTSSTSGECWRTREWTPALAVEPCDPVIKRMSAAPAEQVAQAAPAPVAVPAPVVITPFPQRISFSADALFAFDKAALKPEGKTMLDDLAVQLKGVNYDTIEVTGHADRIGSAAYNQKLSERRANEVKSYLVEKSIPADRISASGLGETQPVTQLADCKGPLNAKRIACLQPDRRVDVEMKGTKPAAAQ